MIVKEFNLGNTKIEVDNTYLVKTEEEKQNVYQQFNKIACEILYERKWRKMTKEQKIYCKIGQAVVNGLLALTVSGIFTAMFLLYIL